MWYHTITLPAAAFSALTRCLPMIFLVDSLWVSKLINFFLSLFIMLLLLELWMLAMILLLGLSLSLPHSLTLRSFPLASDHAHFITHLPLYAIRTTLNTWTGQAPAPPAVMPAGS